MHLANGAVPALAAAALLLAAAPARAEGSAIAPLASRTLGRTVDTVVVRGEAVGKALAGAPVDRLRLFSARGGPLRQIVLQIDERTPDGGYCYDQGPQERRVRDVDGGKLDANDEVLFLARDVGDRLPPAALKLPGVSALQELEVTDPVDRTKGWVYLMRFDGLEIPVRPNTWLVGLQVRKHSDEERTFTWRGEKFVFDNDKSRMNAVRATFATFVDPTTGRRGPPTIDCTIVRAVVQFMWVTVVRQSNDIKVELGAYRAGPLRIVAQNLLKVYLALGLWASAPDSYVMLWPNKVSMPTNARCPVNLDESGESSYTLCMDMAKGARGYKFYNSANSTPVDIDGRVSGAERRLDARWPDWNCVYGPGGAIITKFVIPPAMKRETNRLVYVDDEYHKRQESDEGVEFEKGAFGTNGYYVDMRGLKEGIYPGDYVCWYTGAPFERGDHTKFLLEWDRPLEGKASAP